MLKSTVCYALSCVMVDKKIRKVTKKNLIIFVEKYANNLFELGVIGYFTH